MADWYVREDTSHSGTRNGTSYANAWGGVSEISWASVDPGDTVYICGAHSYSSNFVISDSGTSGNVITIAGNASEEAGSLAFTTGFVSITNDYITLESLPVDSSSASSAIYLGATSTGITINNCTITPGTYGLNMVLSVTNTLVDIAFTNNTVTGGSHGIYGLAIDSTTASINGLEISNNTITGTTQEAIHIRGESDAPNCTVSNVVIRGNVIRDCGASSTGFNGVRVVDDSDNGSWKGFEISNNNISNCGNNSSSGGGMVAGGYYPNTAGTYGSNKISGNNIIGNVGANGGINLFDSSYVEIFNNNCSYNDSTNIDGDGILIDNGNDHIRLYSNTCNYNTGSLNSNTNSGCGIMILGSSDIEVYNNVCKGNKIGFWVGGSSGWSNLSAYNNLFIDCEEYGHYQKTAVTASVFTSRNNVYSGDGTGTGIYVETSGNQQTYSNNVVYNFSTNYNVQTAPGDDITSDPKLNSDHSLQASSPCIGAGTTVLSERDHDGRYRKSISYDIGAKWFDGHEDSTIEELLASGGSI